MSQALHGSSLARRATGWGIRKPAVGVVPSPPNRMCKNAAAVPEEATEYRPNVGVCIVRSDGMVFAAKRCDDHQNTWQMPQGTY